MVQGQQNQRTTLRIEDGHIIAYGTDIGLDVGERKHYALGRTCCSGRIDDKSRIFHPGFNDGLLTADGSQLIIVNQKDFHIYARHTDSLAYQIHLGAGSPDTSGTAILDDVSHIMRC